MSLQTRLGALIDAIGADIKAINTSLASLEPNNLVRTTVSHTTSSLASNASETADVAIDSKSWLGLAISTDVPARVRIYSSTLGRTADADRAIGSDPTEFQGVLLDVVTTSGLLGWSLMPMIVGSNMDDGGTETLLLRVTNLGASATAVTVLFNYLPLET